MHRTRYNTHRSKINNEEWKVGEKILSKNEPVEYYGVSRMTLRKAFDEITDEGLLYRERGIGTFVLKKKIVRSHKKLIGFYEEMVSRGRKVRSLILEKKILRSMNVARELSLNPDADLFYLQRLRFLDNIEIMINETYMSSLIGEKISDADVENKSLF